VLVPENSVGLFEYKLLLISLISLDSPSALKKQINRETSQRSGRQVGVPVDAEFLESEIDWKRVLSDIEKHIDSDEKAKLALKKLTLAGCDKEKIRYHRRDVRWPQASP
jgi:hypothetical protein